jgi:hypothetical protein
MSLRRSDQECSEVFAADVVHIADDAVRRERSGPIWIGLGKELVCGLCKKSPRKEKDRNEPSREHGNSMTLLSFLRLLQTSKSDDVLGTCLLI